MPRAPRKDSETSGREAARENLSGPAASADPEAISNLAGSIPVSDRELEVIEIYLGDLIDSLLGDSKQESQAACSQNARGPRRRAAADKG